MIKTYIQSLCLLCAFALSLPLAAASERADTLRAINWVENPTNHSRPGSRGELGPYQFMPRTWRMHTRVPFQHAVRREQSDAVAVKHYEWIRSGLIAAGIDSNPYNIALAWNSGLSAVTNGRVPTVSYTYAERVHNLVEQLRSRRVAANPDREFRPMASARPTAVRSAEVVTFDPTGAPRFTLATTDPLYEPVVRTQKTQPTSGTVETIPVVKVAAQEAVQPKFALSGAATPRFALIH